MLSDGGEPQLSEPRPGKSFRAAGDRIVRQESAAPLVVTEGSGGVLIAFRVGRSFTAADAVNAYGVAELLALELARAHDRRRDDADRRQALTLYELGRLAIFGEDIEATLHAAVTVLANTVDHDVAHLWISLSDGSLELRAA